MIKNRQILGILVAWSLTGAMACSAGDSTTTTLDYPYRVVATVGMVGDIVQNVAGDRAEVTWIIGPGVDPHVYNPTRSDVVSLSQADIVFYGGLMLEGKMTDVLVRLARTKPVHAVTELLDEDYIISDEDKHYDPHVWMDVQGWIRATEVVVQALSTFDAPNADLYAANGAAYREQLEALDAYAHTTLASIPQGKRVMITAHDAFGYLGRAYDLEVLGIQGISTESEAGLADINRLVDLLVEREIPAVFVETSVSDKNVRALIEGAASRGHKVVVGGELFSDAMGAGGTYQGTYIGMIDHNVTAIARALGGEAPTKGMQGKLEGDKD